MRNFIRKKNFLSSEDGHSENTRYYFSRLFNIGNFFKKNEIGLDSRYTILDFSYSAFLQMDFFYCRTADLVLGGFFSSRNHPAYVENQK